MKPLLALALLMAVATCQDNIDTTVPIVRRPPMSVNLGMFDYFSYSMVLHQLQANPDSRDSSLRDSRIIVSAPMHNITGSSTVNTGAVWTCPIMPGDCSPLSGRLYDTSANGGSENKTNQFLGSSMASNGDNFIVCAHRHKVEVGSFFYPRGICYYSDRSLSSFTSFSPCSRFGNTRASGSGVCAAGASAVVTDSGSNAAYGIGAPGSFLWRGSVTRLELPNTFDFTPSNNQDAFGLLGYTMTTGRFASPTRLDYAVSNPRHSQSTYLGRVVIVSNDPQLTISNQPLAGLQMGEYYGFSLLAANLAGSDGFDELIVGAPMYRSGTLADAGRIFVYSNNNGALVLARTIVGTEAFARFGHAMANLGDINGDGFDDIAVSAPYGAGSGTVFIYYSSSTSTLTPTPAQAITGSAVNNNLILSARLPSIKGFGTSLASGVDVDGNSYNDLAVGTIVSQQVYLLRTRPLAEVVMQFTSDRLIVNVDMMECMLRSDNYACFQVSACIRYSGEGLNGNLNLTVRLVAERQRLQDNLEQRIFFDNGMPTGFPSMISRTLETTTNSQQCFMTTAYVQNGITDRFNGFIIDATVTPPELNPDPTDGNAAPMDFGGFPIVSTSGVTTIQVETFKDCGANMICIPDLGVAITEFSGNNEILTVGAVNQVNLQVRITNTGDDAFQSTLAIRYTTNQLQFQRAYNNTVIGQLTLTCTTTTQDQYTTQTCNIGNPLNSGGSLTVNVLFAPRPELVGNEGTVGVSFGVTSVNEEAPTTRENNNRTLPLTVNAMAEVVLDIPGIVFPESVSYSNIPPNTTTSTVTALGPSVRTTFVVRNNGPSTVPTIALTIMWPLEGSEAGLDTFIYPASISSMSTATVTCESMNINPQNLEIPEEDDNSGEENQVAPPGRRRRRRSVPEKGRKVKRQATGNTDEETTVTSVTRDRTFSCRDNAPTLICVPIRCSILGLQGGSSAQVEILSYVDERFFHRQNDRFTFVPTASVSIVDADYIVATGLGDSSANILAIPASSIIPEAVVPPFPWYAVVFPIIAVIIIIAVIAVILYFCGFFRRAKHEEIKQKREELQNLAENGVTAEPAGDGTNL